jgi:triosephosphate isomerase (TIM)
MKKALVLGNWKMYKTTREALELINALKAGLGDVDAEVGVIPPFTALYTASEALKNSKIKLGAQNVYPANEGAFTGEISPVMLQDLNVSYVLCGHSERRHVLGDSDEFVGKKLLAVAGAGMIPVLCVGEKLEERDAGSTNAIVTGQLEKGLNGFELENPEKLVIAYEPVWAIGTGRVATPEQVAEVHAHIRSWLIARFGAEKGKSVFIQYGGSVKPDNAVGLSQVPDVNGFLVGGASLKPDSYLGIINAYRR